MPDCEAVFGAANQLSGQVSFGMPLDMAAAAETAGRVAEAPSPPAPAPARPGWKHWPTNSMKATIETPRSAARSDIRTTDRSGPVRT